MKKYHIEEIMEEYSVSRMTVTRRAKKRGVTGTPEEGGRGGRLYYTQEEVDKIMNQRGILSSQAVEIMRDNGWDLSHDMLANMLRSGEVCGIKLNIDRRISTRWYYDKKQIEKLVPPKKNKVLTIGEKAEILGISRQTFYTLRKKHPDKLASMLKEAGIE